MPYIMMLVSLLATDSMAKYWIEKHKKPGEQCELGSRIVIKRYHNGGAMLNIGVRYQHFLALLSLVFSAFVTGIFVATLGMRGKGFLKTGLALILGGAYSNTYDRLKRKYVVDYFSIHILGKGKRSGQEGCSKLLGKLDDKFSSIVFNLADFGIIIGAMLLVISESRTA